MKRKKHLLLIEDDDDLRETFERTLSPQFRVTAKRNGLGARRFLSRAEAHTVDCVITDLRMPEVDGLELVELLHDQGLSDVPVLLVTAYADERTWLRATDLDVHAVLSKPVRPSFLRWCVERALS